jgi:hypothetical protein
MVIVSFGTGKHVTEFCKTAMIILGGHRQGGSLGLWQKLAHWRSGSVSVDFSCHCRVLAGGGFRSIRTASRWPRADLLSYQPERGLSPKTYDVRGSRSAKAIRTKRLWVAVAGFEPAPPSSRTRCATQAPRRDSVRLRRGLDVKHRRACEQGLR